MSQITGKVRISSDLADLIVSSHNTRHALCAAAGALYRHVVCPNKESVLTDLLPPAYRFEKSGQSVVNQLLGLGLKAFYDRELLVGAAKTESIFTRLDSHWSEVGAALYLRAALNWFKEPCNLDTVRDERFVLGDLAVLAGRGPEQVPTERPCRPSAAVVYENAIVNEGHIRHVTSNGRGKALVITR